MNSSSVGHNITCRDSNVKRVSLGFSFVFRDAAFLDKYAMERWECVLHYMVGSPGSAENISKDIKDILLDAKLMKCEEGQHLYILSFAFVSITKKSNALTSYRSR